MAQVITQERLKELLHYNPETGIWTWIKARPKINIGDIAGFIDQRGYVRIKIDGKSYKAHRLAFLYMTGTMPEEIDHINGITFDNKWLNLREATHQQNGCNRILLQSNNKSGHKGVRWVANLKKWRAVIQYKGKKIHLGVYNNFEDAVAKRKEAEEQYHGEYRRK